MGRIALATPPAVTPALAVEPPPEVEDVDEAEVSPVSPPRPAPPAPAPGPEAEAPSESADSPAVARLRAAARECAKAVEAATVAQRGVNATRDLRLAEVKVAEANYELAPSAAGLAAVEAARSTLDGAEAEAERATLATKLAVTAERDALRLLERELQREARPTLTDDGTAERALPLLRRLAANERERRALVAELAAFEAQTEDARFACEKALGETVLRDPDFLKRLAGVVTHEAGRFAPPPVRPFYFRPHEAPLGWAGMRWVTAAMGRG